MMEEFAGDLVDNIRAKTNLSWNLSQLCCQTVVENIECDLGITELSKLRDVLYQDVLDVENCRDAGFLRNHMIKMQEVRADAQQRSWSAHEDAPIIAETLTEILEISKLADPRVPSRIMSIDDFCNLQCLIDYYQMESRSSLRVLLVEILQQICLFNDQFIEFMLSSVLPLELARDMIDLNNPGASSDHCNRFGPSLILLTYLFSTGERPPYHYYDTFNRDWVDWVLKGIAQWSEYNEEAVNLLLAFNLHFTHPDENLVLQSLTGCFSRQLSERLLQLANRDEDPVILRTATSTTRSHSVFKLIEDILVYENLLPKESNSDNLELFYLQDLDVLIDIALRQCVNLQSGKIRTHWLALLLLLAPYSNRLNKWESVKSTVESLQDREQECSMEDDDILNRFNALLIEEID